MNGPKGEDIKHLQLNKIVYTIVAKKKKKGERELRVWECQNQNPDKYLF